MARPANRLTGAAPANALLGAQPVPQSTALPVAAPLADVALPMAQMASNFPPTDRVSTRIPDSIKNPPPTDPHTDARYVIDADSARADPDSHAKNMALIRQHHGEFIPGVRSAKNDVDTETAFKQHIKDNLRWLYDQVPKAIRPRSKLWYDGAHRIAQDLADDYGISHRQAAGVLASLSPQKDWFQNVELARRLLSAADYAPTWRPPGPRALSGAVGADRGRRGTGARGRAAGTVPEAA